MCEYKISPNFQNNENDFFDRAVAFACTPFYKYKFSRVETTTKYVNLNLIKLPGLGTIAKQKETDYYYNMIVDIYEH